MGLTQLDIIRKQIESAAKNRVAGEAAKLRRRTSLIGEISRLTGKANRAIDDAGQQAARRYASRRPETLDDDQAPAEDNTRPPQARVYADGYVRRSPEQPLYTPPDYRSKQIRRAIGIIVLAALVLAIVWLLLRMSVFSI